MMAAIARIPPRINRDKIQSRSVFSAAKACSIGATTPSSSSGRILPWVNPANVSIVRVSSDALQM